jgi:hypothetical protein
MALLLGAAIGVALLFLALNGIVFFCAWYSGNTAAMVTVSIFMLVLIPLGAPIPAGTPIADYPIGVWTDTALVIIVFAMPWLCRKAGV